MKTVALQSWAQFKPRNTENVYIHVNVCWGSFHFLVCWFGFGFFSPFCNQTVNFVCKAFLVLNNCNLRCDYNYSVAMKWRNILIITLKLVPQLKIASDRIDETKQNQNKQKTPLQKTPQIKHISCTSHCWADFCHETVKQLSVKSM